MFLVIQASLTENRSFLEADNGGVVSRHISCF